MRTREDIINSLSKFENLIWDVSLLRNRITRKKSTTLLKKNNLYKDTHLGETCFILGNGPSLKLETRLHELANYTVFTVNQMYRSEIFDIVKPQFHVIMDPLFFELRDNIESEADTLFKIRSVAKNESIQMILPSDAYSYIKHNIGCDTKHIYVKGRYKLNDNFKKDIDMCGYLPASRNVVQTAIYCSIYMGFKRIVMLGCDMTGLLDNYVKRSIDKTEKFSHVYKYTNDEKDRMKKVHSKFSNEYMLFGFTEMFHDYRIIHKICDEKGIELINASQITALDNVPYSNLNDILNVLR